jgi:hypothetical protein
MDYLQHLLNGMLSATLEQEGCRDERTAGQMPV